MVKLNDKMKDFIGTHLAYVATTDKDGNPNIGPKRSCRILDDNKLIFNENTGKQTLKNIKENGKVAVAFVDWEKLDGYRFIGHAEVYDCGEFYDSCCEWAKGKMGVPKSGVVITIEKVYTLRSGQTAGDEIVEF